MRLLDVIRSGSVTPARDLAIQRHLLTQVEKNRDGAVATLHLGRLTGDALGLGRYQRLSSALDASGIAGRDVVRRLTGGRTIRLGEGVLSLSLVMATPSGLLTPGSGAIGPEKVINRYVRGLLAGLHTLGLKAYYFGRDFLSVNRRHGGYLSFEVAPGGVTLFQALIAVSTRTVPDDALNGYPGMGGNRPDPEPTTLEHEVGRSLDLGAVEDAVVEAYVRHQLVEARERSFTPLEATLLGEREAQAWPAESVEEAGWGRSDLKPIACGYLEASVQLVQARFLGAVRLHGDFMSNSGALDRLERDLKLVPLDWREIGTVVDRVFGEPGNVIQGVRYLRVIPDAILEAAERAGASGRTERPGPSL